MDAALSPEVSRRQAAAGLGLVIVDYGMGNVRSVANALARLGCAATVSDRPAMLHEAEAIVLPGVGGFGEAMRALSRNGLAEALRKEVLERGATFLGICLGMQLLARRSFEHGEHEGLGWIEATVEYVPPGRRVPHVGWTPVRADPSDPLFADIAPSASFYFDHSLHVVPAEAVRTASFAYGTELVASLAKGNVFATQFHPEKSERTGLRLLRNFLNICLDRRATMAVG